MSQHVLTGWLAEAWWEVKLMCLLSGGKKKKLALSQARFLMMEEINKMNGVYKSKLAVWLVQTEGQEFESRSGVFAPEASCHTGIEKLWCHSLSNLCFEATLSFSEAGMGFMWLGRWLDGSMGRCLCDQNWGFSFQDSCRENPKYMPNAIWQSHKQKVHVRNTELHKTQFRV